jgi:hypothetical protein
MGSQVDKTLRYFKIHYSDVTSQSAGQTAIYHPSAQSLQSGDFSYLMGEAFFTTSHRYAFQVSAYNNIEGDLSNKQQILVQLNNKCVKLSLTIDDGTTPLDYDLSPSSTSNQSVLVEIRNTGDISNIIGYKLIVVSDDTVEKVSRDVACTDKNKQCLVRVKHINPSTLYTFTAHAVDKDGRLYSMCTQDALRHNAGGVRPVKPVIAAVKVVSNGAVQLTWRRKDEHPSSLLTVYYNYIQSFWSDVGQWQSVTIDVSDSRNGSFDIDRLHGCVRYCFVAQITSPLRSVVGLSRSDYMCVDLPDYSGSPPKNIKVSRQVPLNDNLTANVTLLWTPPCSLKQMSYIIAATDDTGHSEFFNATGVAGQPLILKTISGFYRGAVYEYSVRQDVVDSDSSAPLSLTVLPFRAPSEFKVYTTLSGVELSWSAPRDKHDVNFKMYEIYHTTEYVSNHSATFQLHSVTTNEQTHISHTDIEMDVEHTFKVRMISVHGYPGQFSNVQTIRPLADSYPASPVNGGQFNTGLLAGLLAMAVLLIVAISTILTVYVVRHRRLQQSFTSFANSHYDSRSERTTFGANDLEEDDQPLIRNFADDEPLIVG